MDELIKEWKRINYLIRAQNQDSNKMKKKDSDRYSKKKSNKPKKISKVRVLLVTVLEDQKQGLECWEWCGHGRNKRHLYRKKMQENLFIVRMIDDVDNNNFIKN